MRSTSSRTAALGCLAQLVRALPLQGSGLGFESLNTHHFLKTSAAMLGSFVFTKQNLHMFCGKYQCPS
jgi:hypothetical protein